MNGFDSNILKEKSIDFALSQAVLEHVNNLDLILENLRRILKPNAIMSHVIDFKSRGYTIEWNGHWNYPEYIWKIFNGKRLIKLNRLPYSVHKSKIKNFKFEILQEIKYEGNGPSITKEQLARQFKHFSEEDLKTGSLFIQAKNQ